MNHRARNEFIRKMAAQLTVHPSEAKTSTLRAAADKCRRAGVHIKSLEALRRELTRHYVPPASEEDQPEEKPEQ